MDTNNYLERYHELMLTAPALFTSSADDGIAILTTDSGISEAEAAAKLILQKKGLPSCFAQVGVVYEDQYVWFLRDAVRFKNDSLGTYIRIVHKNLEFAGVAIIPRCDQKFVLIRHFRHATRKWHWEIPRGFADSRNPIDTVSVELKEEIGAVPLNVRRLGTYFPDSGLLASSVHIYLADVAIGQASDADEVEAISKVQSFEFQELNAMIRDGHIDDGFTLVAIAFLRSYLDAGTDDRTMDCTEADGRP
jgi:ADP-ribose pyrophosphatase